MKDEELLSSLQRDLFHAVENESASQNVPSDALIDPSYAAINGNEQTGLMENADRSEIADTTKNMVQHHTPFMKVMSDAAEVNKENTVSRVLSLNKVDAFDAALYIVRDGNRLAVTLEPDGLGRLDINLSMDKGMLHAQVRVSDDAARNLIGNNMQQIVDALAQEGLTVGGFSVSLKGGGAGDAAPHGPYEHSDAAQSGAQEVSGEGRSETNGIVNIFV